MTPATVCLVPVKNEAWLLESFLRAASLWADHVVIADQGSTDDSRSIAARFPKVHLINNPAADYNEGARQTLLVNAAREIVEGPRALIAIDADEALASTLIRTHEWDRMLSAAPGTVIRFKWANLVPGGGRAWVPGGRLPFGYIDDGATHQGDLIHSVRIPGRPGSPTLDVSEDAPVLHRQYLDWERMEAKQRWYQAWEWVNNPGRHAIDIYRQYHHMYAVPASEFCDVPARWLEAYAAAGIDLTQVGTDGRDAWDRGVLDLFEARGPAAFRKLDVWGIDWKRRARELEIEAEVEDPRGAGERAVHRWLRRTQGRPVGREIFWGEKLLRRLGW